MKKISVLGTGWLGFALSSNLFNRGFDVKGSTRSSERMALLQENGIQPFVVDVTKGKLGLDNFFDCETMIINIPFKGVPEFAALIKRIENSTIKNIIFISSTSVYGNKNGEISEQDHDCLITSPLLEIEHLFTSNSHFSTTIVRFAGLIGYGRNPALFFKNNRLVKSPESPVNMIHRDDCINIIWLIIEKKAWGKIYNCCADTHPTKRVFYSYAATVSALPIPRFSEESESSYKVISNNKVKTELQYDFLHPNLLKLKF